VIRALVLGIVQGLTEFLPISSSAHLAIVPRLLGYPTPALAFEVLLHFGTMAAVAAYFARDLWAFVLCLVAPGRLGLAEARVRRRLLGLLALASVPAAVVGYLVQDWADAQTDRPLRASVWLVLTTSIMIAAELYDRRRTARAVPVAYTAAGEARRAATDPGGPPDQGAATAAPGEPLASRADRLGHQAAVAEPPASRDERHGHQAAVGDRPGEPPASRDEGHGRAAVGDRPGDPEEELRRLPAPKAAGIGLAQALALIPGTSRSGVTISAGLFLGVSREAAARFSFLLSIPAILGAGILKLDDLSSATESPAELAVGTLAAAISGFVAVSFLIRLLRTRTLWPFIWYRLVAGGLFILLLTTVRS
jgi:undecaprenyl pyrophosphate phosphatase UppP